LILRYKDHDSKADASSDLLNPSARRAAIESGDDGLRLRQRRLEMNGGPSTGALLGGGNGYRRRDLKPVPVKR
jgi:hypothetical protein